MADELRPDVWSLMKLVWPNLSNCGDDIFERKTVDRITSNVWFPKNPSMSVRYNVPLDAEAILLMEQVLGD